MKMNEILESSGWGEKNLEDGLVYEIPLSDIKYYYEQEGDRGKVYSKRKYKNSKLWGERKLVIEDNLVEIGMYLAENGLLNEGEFNVEKRKYLKRKAQEQEEELKMKKEQKRSNIQVFIYKIKADLINATKKVAVFSLAIVGSYATYHYVNNQVDPASLYVYIKNNIGHYDFKDIVANEAVGGLTYSQIRNVDYAIENDQVEELLQKIEDVPENINYISVLKENVKKENN